MRLPVVLLLLLAAGLRCLPALATTWDEPWQEAVVKNADSFVLARITAVDAQKGISLSIIRTLAGGELAGQVAVTSFSLLSLCSSSGGEGPEFHLAGVDTCYFFLKQITAGVYAIATPTTGFAPVREGRVVATYRHSYHQALVPAAVYEPTMTAIFRHYHGQPYDEQYVAGFVGKYLALAPAKIDAAGMPTFFLQHAALETAYHLGLSSYYPLVLPFLHDNTNFHAQLSAARALRATPTPAARQQLLALLQDKSTQDFPKVVAVWALGSYRPRELKPRLQELAKAASEAETGFGGNIMDPRVCTHVPSVRKALTELVAQL